MVPLLLLVVAVAIVGCEPASPSRTAWDVEQPRAAAAVAMAGIVVAPPAPEPQPPAPAGCACGGKCTGGTYKPDGRISMDCDADCKCGCRKATTTKCHACLGTGNVMQTDGTVRRCTSCSR